MKQNLRRSARDIDWTVHVNADGTWPDAKVQMALLSDIREELKRLNNTLACPRFLDIPSKLDRIEKNTKKRRKPKKAAPKLRVVGGTRS